jgi:transcriptional regulator with XRE-family HTH domain
MPLVDGRALRKAREKKGSDFTQSRLSEEAKVDVSTISRAERQKTSRVRERTLKAFAKALDVDPKSLGPSREPERDVMKVRMEIGARNALTLVAYRYGVPREVIIEAAPLLFYIAAEQCLQQRQERITELRASAHALFDLQRAIRHLPAYWPIDNAAVGSEEKSIRAQDLFGTKVMEDAQQFMNEFDEDYEEADNNPFVSFLRDTLSRISNATDQAASVSCSPSSCRYRICAAEAADFVGSDPQAITAILLGVVALHELPNCSPEDRGEWAKAEFDRKFPDDDL